MRFSVRRITIGLACGVVASFPLAAVSGNASLAVFLVAGCGALYSLSNPLANKPGASVDGMFTAAALGIPLWGAFSVFALPVMTGQGPQWTAEGMRALFPALVGWLLAGALLGFLTPIASWIAERFLGPEPAEKSPVLSENKRRILILGGGFAGVGTASELERLFRADPSVEFTLVSETNALLFTPMLTEVAASSLEPTHISSPLRTSLRRTRVVRGRVLHLDLDCRRVRVERGEGSQPPDCEADELPYDQG